jgi:ABC-type transport system substrate-binding protein
MKILLAIFLACAALIARGADTPKYGGELRVPMTTDITSFDPARCYISPGINIVRLCYAGLVDYDDGTKILPVLAQSWEIRGGTNFIFKLDPAARFSNGRSITAADYVYSIARTLSATMNCPGGFMYARIVGLKDFQDGKTNSISGVTARGDYELEFNLDQPDPTFLYKLAMPFMAPVAREIAEPLGGHLDAISAGAGPMILKRYRRGVEMLLERGPIKNQRCNVYIDRLRVLIGSNDTVHEMMFENGELDIANLMKGIVDTQVARVRRDPRLSKLLYKEPFSQIWFAALNTEIKPFDSKLVRKAFNYGINRARMIEKSRGIELAVPGMIPPSLPGYNTNLVGYSYAPDKARELLRQAGYPDGFATTLWVGNDEERLISAAQMMQEDLQQVGIRLELKIVTMPTLIEAAGTRKNVACSISGWLQDYPDESTFLELVRGSNITEKDCQNLSFYKNDKVDAILDEAARTMDDEARRVLYRKAEEIVVDDAPLFFWMSPYQFCLHQPWVKGLLIHPVWVFAFDKMWIDR